MTGKKAGKEAKNNIWSLITVEQLATAIASLGNRIKGLDKETWRLSTQTKLSNSLWVRIIEKLGINHIEQTLIMWDNELENNECTFSPIVWCHNKPILLQLSQSSCLSQLFDDYQSVTDKCQVNPSPNTGQGIMYIGDGLWLFYNTHLTYYCQVNSSLNELIETTSTNEAVLIRVPCDKTVTYLNFQLSAASCKANQVIITPCFTSVNHHLPHFIVPIQNMNQTLVSAYHIQLEKLIKSFMLTSPLIQSKFKDTIHDIGLTILSALCSIFAMIFIYILKYIKYQYPRDMNNVQSQIEDIIFP